MIIFRILFTILFILITFELFCQSKFKYGLDICAIQNFYKSRNPDAQSFLIGHPNSFYKNISTGFNFRFTYQIEKETSVSAAPGIRFFKSFNELDFSTHKATFFDLPIQVNHHLFKNIYLIAGVRLSFLNRIERHDNDFYIFTPTRNKNILPATQHKLFYTPKLGFGINVIESLNIEISYNHSLRNLISVSDPFLGSSIQESYKNDFLQLSVIYTDLKTLFSGKGY